MKALLIFFLFTHGVETYVEEVKGVSIAVQYADGSPMAFADVKIKSPSGKEKSGQTDDNGRIVFYPDENGKWRVEIDDGLGHGAVKEIEWSGAIKEEERGRMTQIQKILTGTGIILGISGIISYILLIKEKRKNAHS